MIPILDWRLFAGDSDPQRFVNDLGLACRDSGFFLLRNHGIDRDLVDQVFASADSFFELTEAEKRTLSIYSNPHNRGWAKLGSEKLDETGTLLDRKEAFNIGLDLPAHDPRVRAREPFRGVNLWPEIPGFRDVMLRYFDSAMTLGVTLHRAIAADLGLPEDFFRDKFDAPMATLRLLHYPPGTGTRDEIGAGNHTDYGSITILKTDDEPGLQVKTRDGAWLDVPNDPDALVINIGDCLMRWSNDIYVSTPHRVLPPKRRRRSIAFFLDPNPDALIEALPGTGAARYPSVTGAEYLRSRLSATYMPTHG
ncbi:isopenicillin N synthase family dioxygenase [Tropicimonas sp.]|uniref:isopenicillin N synthase family dioxygenase n=1 Tax=Tropicimonas sp. TaxID=2067044 RepID=UPI003A85D347